MFHDDLTRDAPHARVAALLLFLVAASMQSVPAQSILHVWPGQFNASAIDDVDGDRIADIALFDAGDIKVYSGGTGALISVASQVPPFAWYPYVIWPHGDFDSDGSGDFFAAFYPSAGYVDYAIVSGRTGAVLRAHPMFSLTATIRPGLGDVNGDGVDDLVFNDPYATVGGLVVAGILEIWDGRTGAVLRSHAGSVAFDYFGAGATVNDLDGDGVRDYTARGSSLSYLGFSGRTGQQLFALPPHSNLSAAYDVGDFNADGFNDFALNNIPSGPNPAFVQTLVFGGPNGAVLWNNIHWYASPTPGVHAVTIYGAAGDLDGDGHADAYARGGPTGTQLCVISGRDQSLLWEFIPASPNVFGHAMRSPGDVNGDGFPDLLALRITNPGWIEHIVVFSGAPPGVTLFGQGCLDFGGQSPAIGVGIGARLGRTMTVNLSKASTSTVAAFLALGYSNTTWNGVALPLDLAVIGFPGCDLLIAPDQLHVVPTAGLNGTPHHAHFPIPVPNAPQLLGLSLFAQWLVLEQGPSGLHGSVTRGAQAIVSP